MKKSKIKHSYNLSTLSISLVLFLLGVVLYIGYQVESTTNDVVGHIRVSALIKDGSKISDIDSLISKLESFGEVEKVEYISKDRAAEIYKRATGDDFTLFIDNNPLPASIDIAFVGDSISKSKIDMFCKKLENNNNLISEVLQSQDVVDEVLGYIYKVKFVLYSFIIVLLVISIVLINNAIKLTVRSKRFIIRSMKLIGATDYFIRMPFITSAIKQGIVSSFFAWLMFLLSYIAISRGPAIFIENSELLMEVTIVFIIILSVGLSISVICTTKAVNKQLIERNRDLHIY